MAQRRRDPRAYTPRHLVEKVLASKSALEGERKYVTVFFADVKGSVALSEGLDPEEWHRTLDALFEILADGVHRFEGTVNQYTGDGIMALFGAPLALEDHAHRACHAALYLRDALRDHAHRLRVERGIDLRVRLALNSGEVVVGAIGDDLRMDYTAQGATVGLAARLQEVAAPERVYVSEHTAALVEGWFDLRDLGPTTLKGLAQPVRLFELDSAAAPRTRLELARERGLTPFVGRDDQLALLDRALESAAAGEGQLVGVVGEAGVGKSRLCLEFARRCAARGLPVHAAACPSHVATLPLFLLRDLVRSLVGIERGPSTESDPGARVAARLRELDPALEEHAGLLLELLEIRDPERPPPAMDSEARRRLLVETLRQLLASHGRRQPLLLLLDDLHWVDAESDALLAELLGVVPETRAFVLANFRPEYRAPWMQRTDYQQLGLRALAAESTAELVQVLLGGDPSLRELAGRLCEATRGNPFFLEEIVHSLADRGVLHGEAGRYHVVEPDAELILPKTVQTVLAARIDRLPEREKEILCVASVVGRRFAEPLVSRIAQLPQAEVHVAIGGLCAAELVRRERAYPEPEYAFRHPLTHEVAYESQLRARRRRFHSAVAWVLASEGAAKTAEESSLVSHHLEQAGHALEAARWRWRAVEAFGFGSERALVPHLKHVIRLTDGIAEDREAARLGMWARMRLLSEGILSGISPEEGDRSFEEGKAIAERLGHLPALAALHGWYANFLSGTGRRAQMWPMVEEARRLAAQSGSRRALLQVSFGVLAHLMGSGRFREALAFSEEAIAADRGDLRGVDAVMAAHAKMLRAEILEQVGRLRESLAQGEAATAMAESAYHPQVAVRVVLSRAAVAFFLGEHEMQLEATREAIERADTWRNPWYRTETRRCAAAALVCLGRCDDAIVLLDEVRRFPPDDGDDWGPGFEKLLRAEALVGLGQFEEARRVALHGWESVGQLTYLESRLWGHWHLTYVLLRVDAHGDRTRIESILDECEAMVGRTGAESWTPYLRLERAELAERLGDAGTAERERRAAVRELRAMDAMRAAERVEALLAESA